jgi:diguanylate cyclase (GGDEF)-like protein
MQSLDALNLIPVWVNPEHLASTAKIILAGHRLKVLGVVEGSDLVGVITSYRTSAASDNTQVREFMQAPETVVDASTPLRQLAETFWREDLDYLPVIQGNKFRGIVTPNMLLKEMARSWDPLTGLSWSDRLREWGVEHLKQGLEITIMFIDLDDFGSYNKRYGHIVGDRVLQRVAEMVEEKIDPALDQLVRYGGDEFAIGTIRDQGDAMELARSLQEAMSRVRVAGSDEPVTFSIGVQGGKRTKERENVHYAATLDNLINLASKLSNAEKASKKGGTAAASEVPDLTAISGPETPDVSASQVSTETAADIAEAQADGASTATIEPELQTEKDAQPISVAMQESPPDHAVIEERESGAEVSLESAPQDDAALEVGPLTISEVVADAADANSVTQVSIDANGLIVTGICPRKGGSVLKSVALATANALAQIRPDVKLEIRELNLTESETGIRFISVIGTGKVNGEDQPIGGVGTVGRNVYLTVAEATLQAYTNFDLMS